MDISGGLDLARGPPVDIECYIASLLLKLETVHNVSVQCIDELVDDLHFIKFCPHFFS